MLGGTMAEKPPFQITLPRMDVYQLLDGIAIRAESYRKTQQYYLTGACDGIIEEVSNEHEAGNIAKDYEQIHENITQQIKEQDMKQIKEGG